MKPLRHNQAPPSFHTSSSVLYMLQLTKKTPVSVDESSYIIASISKTWDFRVLFLGSSLVQHWIIFSRWRSNDACIRKKVWKHWFVWKSLRKIPFRYHNDKDDDKGKDDYYHYYKIAEDDFVLFLIVFLVMGTELRLRVPAWQLNFIKTLLIFW